MLALPFRDPQHNLKTISAEINARAEDRSMEMRQTSSSRGGTAGAGAGASSMTLPMNESSAVLPYVGKDAGAGLNNANEPGRLYGESKATLV